MANRVTAPLLLCHVIVIWLSRVMATALGFAYHRQPRVTSESRRLPSSEDDDVVSYHSHPHRRRRTRMKIAGGEEGGDHGDDIRHDDADITSINGVGPLLPLFVERERLSMGYSIVRSDYDGGMGMMPPSLSMTNSMDRARRRLHSISPTADDRPVSGDNNCLLRRIVQMGIEYERRRERGIMMTDEGSHAIPPGGIYRHDMERVPGCIATVHLGVTLISTSHMPDGTVDDTAGRGRYRVFLNGTSDAMLSGGLLAILAEIACGGRGDADIYTQYDDDDDVDVVTADDILHLDPDTFTADMGLHAVLSRGRNDGMSSMVRMVQRQIRSLLGGGVEVDTSSSFDGTASTTNVAAGVKPCPFSYASPVANEQVSIIGTGGRPSVAMLLSGGVDSSVALHLLLRQNYNVTCFYLRIWLEDELAHLGECPWENDMIACRAVCEHAGDVPLVTVSLGDEYREKVIQYTIDEARRGRTPNPDIMCNSMIKFGCFLDYIDNCGMAFDHVASGHYARAVDDEGVDPTTGATTRPIKRLFRAPDPIKDQSYFLCALTQQQLSNVLFPIGEYHKSEVRELAARFELPNRDRPDSQGLCFLGKVRFDDFISSYLGTRPGDVMDALNGEVIGRHNGLWYHTVGQRKGIGRVMFPLATARGPWYVVAKDQKRNIVYVSNKYDDEDFAIARCQFEVEDVRWISGEAPMEIKDGGGGNGPDVSWNDMRIDLKIRHGPRVVKGTLSLKSNGTMGNIRLDEKDGGLAPGQYVVFYRTDTHECLGAGVISERHWATFLQNYEEVVTS